MSEIKAGGEGVGVVYRNEPRSRGNVRWSIDPRENAYRRNAPCNGFKESRCDGAAPMHDHRHPAIIHSPGVIHCSAARRYATAFREWIRSYVSRDFICAATSVFYNITLFLLLSVYLSVCFSVRFLPLFSHPRVRSSVCFCIWNSTFLCRRLLLYFFPKLKLCFSISPTFLLFFCSACFSVTFLVCILQYKYTSMCLTV